MKPPALKNLKIPDEHLLRTPLLESLYRDQIPPTASNLRCRWAEIVQEYEGAIGNKSPFPGKLTVQALLKMYGGWPDTLVIVDQQVETAVVPNGETRREALLKMFAPGPGKSVPAALLQRAASPGLKLRAEPEVFLAGFRVVPEFFKGFIDPLGVDLYPEELWDYFGQYLNDLIAFQRIQECTFSGGRYGTAKELVNRNLPFLQGRSLGEVAHLVQLALSPCGPDGNCSRGRGLLSYQADKMIVPRVLSQRHLLADRGLPTTPSLVRRVGQDCATDDERWAELKHILHVVLSEHPEGRSLALLKVDVEHRFNMILDQSVFKEVKLSHIFECPQLKDVFEVLRVAQQGGGVSQVVIRLKSFNQANSKGPKNNGKVKGAKGRSQQAALTLPMCQEQVVPKHVEPDGSPRRRSWPFAMPPDHGPDGMCMPSDASLGMNLAYHQPPSEVNRQLQSRHPLGAPRLPMAHVPMSQPAPVAAHPPPGNFGLAPPPPPHPPPPVGLAPPAHPVYNYSNSSAYSITGLEGVPPPPPPRRPTPHTAPASNYSNGPAYGTGPGAYPAKIGLPEDRCHAAYDVPPRQHQHTPVETPLPNAPMLPVPQRYQPARGAPAPPGLEFEAASSSIHDMQRVSMDDSGIESKRSLTAGFLPAAGFIRLPWDGSRSDEITAALMESNSPKASDFFARQIQPGKENSMCFDGPPGFTPKHADKSEAPSGFTPKHADTYFLPSGMGFTPKNSDTDKHEVPPGFTPKHSGFAMEDDGKHKFDIWGSQPLGLLL